MNMTSPVSINVGTLFACNAQALAWVPWAMQGSHFKLLHADPESGRFTLLIKFDKDVAAPLHRHIGAVEGYMLEGSFYYHDNPDIVFTPGSYLYENEGAVHRPISPEGGIMFAVFHGPIEGVDEAGNITGRIDWKWHVKTWNAAQEAARPAAS
jgi:2,4'-dihydroxyacetophenone dioxygenase